MHTSTATIFGNASSGFVRVAPVVRPPKNSDMPATLKDPTCTANACTVGSSAARSTTSDNKPREDHEHEAGWVRTWVYRAGGQGGGGRPNKRQDRDKTGASARSRDERSLVPLCSPHAKAKAKTRTRPWNGARPPPTRRACNATETAIDPGGGGGVG